MAETPRRPTTRALRRSLGGNGRTASPPRAPLTRSRLRNSLSNRPPLSRPQSSFPTLAVERTPVARRVASPRPAIGKALRVASPRPAIDRALRLASPRPVASRAFQDESPTHGVSTPFRRQSFVNARHGRLAADADADAESPTGRGSVLSPGRPAGAPGRRLSFMGARHAAQSADGAAMFTPLATKLIRPDPSVFMSSGLQSKRQRASRRISSYLAPETPCKSSSTIPSVIAKSAPEPVRLGHMPGRPSGADSGMVTPTNQIHAPAFDVTADPGRLGKHRNSSANSLQRLRKKPHFGPDEGVDDEMALALAFSSPRRVPRPRRSTLVEDELGQGMSPPGLLQLQLQLQNQLHHHQQSSGQQLFHRLAADRSLDPGMAIQRMRAFGSSLLSWISGSEPCPSESSAATLASSSMSHEAEAPAKQRRPLPALPARLDHDMDHDMVVTEDDFSEDDVFGSGLTRSPRILAAERPQMPQIMQGCATNYAHFLGREYFAQADRSLPFLSPSDEFRVDGLGYLDYFAHQFEAIGLAGEGNFSTVVSVRSLVDGQLYAVKKTREPYTGRQERARRLREVDLLWAVGGSPGVVRLVNAWEQFGHLYMQFELCEQGSLADYLDMWMSREGSLPEARVWAILAHAASAIGRLHDAGIAHLDVKPANFLLGAGFGSPGGEQHEGWLKLADFGHAARLPYEKMAWVDEGDREYMAPEVLHGRYTAAADVFSLGMMMLEITAEINLPHNGVDWQKLREGLFDDPMFHNLPYSKDLQETIKRMLHPDSRKRPGLRAVLALPQCALYTSAPAGRPGSIAAVVAASEDDDDRDDLVSRPPILRGSFQYHHRMLMRAATADAESFPGMVDHLSVHPMMTRSAAAAKTPPPPPPPPPGRSSNTARRPAPTPVSRRRLPPRRGLMRRAVSAPGSVATISSTGQSSVSRILRAGRVATSGSRR
ncbi:mitosis inhibitor protein kinase swe1 [Kickxella alabastrina]|nr:mitosis inhibitor protein kinase swe1 [Kickxella alabastrina]